MSSHPNETLDPFSNSSGSPERGSVEDLQHEESKFREIRDNPPPFDPSLLFGQPKEDQDEVVIRDLLDSMISIIESEEESSPQESPAVNDSIETRWLAFSKRQKLTMTSVFELPQICHNLYNALIDSFGAEQVHDLRSEDEWQILFDMWNNSSDLNEAVSLTMQFVESIQEFLAQTENQPTSINEFFKEREEEVDIFGALDSGMSIMDTMNSMISSIEQEVQGGFKEEMIVADVLNDIVEVVVTMEEMIDEVVREAALPIFTNARSVKFSSDIIEVIEPEAEYDIEEEDSSNPTLSPMEQLLKERAAALMDKPDARELRALVENELQMSGYIPTPMMAEDFFGAGTFERPSSPSVSHSFFNEDDFEEEDRATAPLEEFHEEEDMGSVSIRNLLSDLKMSESVIAAFEAKNIQVEDLPSLPSDEVRALIPEKKPRKLFNDYVASANFTSDAARKKQEAKRQKYRAIGIPSTIEALFKALKFPERYAELFKVKGKRMSHLLSMDKTEIRSLLPNNAAFQALQAYIESNREELATSTRNLKEYEKLHPLQPNMVGVYEYKHWEAQNVAAEERQRKAEEDDNAFYESEDELDAVPTAGASFAKKPADIHAASSRFSENPFGPESRWDSAVRLNESGNGSIDELNFLTKMPNQMNFFENGFVETMDGFNYKAPKTRKHILKRQERKVNDKIERGFCSTESCPIS